jgi:hypothetical protein
MKFVEPRPFADPEAAARKLIEIANSVEPVQDGRLHTCPFSPRAAAVLPKMAPG